MMERREGGGTKNTSFLRSWWCGLGGDWVEGEKGSRPEQVKLSVRRTRAWEFF